MMMHRNASAALAALFCLLSGPLLFAARPTRPAHPAPRYATSEPHLRASRERSVRAPLIASTRHPARQNASSRHATARKKTASRAVPQKKKAARITPAAHLSTRRRVRPTPQDNSTFIARSVRAAAERRNRNEDTDAFAAAELRTRLDRMDSETPLLPAARTLSLYDDRGRLIVPAPMRGSREVLLHQNEMADRAGLTRIQDDDDLDQMRSARLLVPLPASDALRVDARLPADRRYSRPWTAIFLAAMSRDFYASFHSPLQVDSAVRTVDVQKHLVRVNGNAAPAQGETASPHLTGQAVDIAKRGLTLAEIAWLRLYLQPLMDAGKIDVEEEFRQACFHISVYKNYVPAAAARLSVAATAAPPDAEP
jgi:hypothetical protein